MSKNIHPHRKKVHAHQPGNAPRKEKQKAREKELDETLESTFPASDATAKYY